MLSSRQPTSLKYVFSGYTIWLLVSEIDSDLQKVTEKLSAATFTQRIEVPHVTLFYNVDYKSHESALDAFSRVKTKCQYWPSLDPITHACKKEFDGVDGARMVRPRF